MFRKPTDKDITFRAMEHYLLPNGKIDSDYLNNQIQIVLMNTRSMRRKIGKRIPAMTLVLDAMRDIADNLLAWNDDGIYSSRDYQLESWLNEFGDGTTTVRPSIELINNVRGKEWEIC